MNNTKELFIEYICSNCCNKMCLLRTIYVKEKDGITTYKCKHYKKKSNTIDWKEKDYYWKQTN